MENSSFSYFDSFSVSVKCFSLIVKEELLRTMFKLSFLYNARSIYEIIVELRASIEVN